MSTKIKKGKTLIYQRMPASNHRRNDRIKGNKQSAIPSIIVGSGKDH